MQGGICSATSQSAPSQIPMGKNLNSFGYVNSEVVSSYRYKQKQKGQFFETNLNPYHEQQSKKSKYNVFRRQQLQNQRRKVKQSQNRRKEQQRHQKQAKLMSDLEKKKGELEDLQNLKKRAQEEERRSEELAIIKTEKDQIRKIEEIQKAKENKHFANLRFTEALRRLQDEGKQRDSKKTQAIFRRKITEDTQKLERSKAVQYKATIQEKDKQQKTKIPEKVSFVDYKQILGRNAYGINHLNSNDKDFAKSYSHNPKIIVARRHLQAEESSNSNNAIQRAAIYQQIHRSNSARRRQNQQMHRKKSVERGRKATQKLQEQKQYESYCDEAEEKALQYNLQLIEEGKRNQYSGIRPSTLQQIRTEKQGRSEEEFQREFSNFNRDKVRVASKYEMVRGRELSNKQMSQYDNDKQIVVKTFNVPIDRDHFYRDGKHAQNPHKVSVIGQDSKGKYSFEDSVGLDGMTSVKKHNNQHQQNRAVNEDEENNSQEDDDFYATEAPRQNPKPAYVHPPITYDNKDLKQTDYRDLHRQDKTMHEFHTQHQLTDNLDTNIIRRYGIDRQYKVYNQEAPQRKIVYNEKGKVGFDTGQVSNVCGNRRKNQDLDYSESEEDSDI